MIKMETLFTKAQSRVINLQKRSKIKIRLIIKTKNINNKKIMKSRDIIKIIKTKAERKKNKKSKKMKNKKNKKKKNKK